jgi:hypothetical protein
MLHEESPAGGRTQAGDYHENVQCSKYLTESRTLVGNWTSALVYSVLENLVIVNLSILLQGVKKWSESL